MKSTPVCNNVWWDDNLHSLTLGISVGKSPRRYQHSPRRCHRRGGGGGGWLHFTSAAPFEDAITFPLHVTASHVSSENIVCSSLFRWGFAVTSEFIACAFPTQGKESEFPKHWPLTRPGATATLNADAEAPRELTSGQRFGKGRGDYDDDDDADDGERWVITSLAAGYGAVTAHDNGPLSAFGRGS